MIRDTRIPDGLRILRMIGLLHRRGYERLRFLPGLSPSGMYWRCAITVADNWRDNDLVAPYGDRAVHTGNSEEFPFGWPDAADATPARLADLFERRHGDLLRDASQPDPAYAAWFANMLRQLGRSRLPVAYADYTLPWQGEAWSTICLKGEPRRIPLPPRAPGKPDRPRGMSID